MHYRQTLFEMRTSSKVVADVEDFMAVVSGASGVEYIRSQGRLATYLHCYLVETARLVKVAVVHDNIVSSAGQFLPEHDISA